MRVSLSQRSFTETRERESLEAFLSPIETSFLYYTGDQIFENVVTQWRFACECGSQCAVEIFPATRRGSRGRERLKEVRGHSNFVRIKGVEGKKEKERTGSGSLADLEEKRSRLVNCGLSSADGPKCRYRVDVDKRLADFTNDYYV